MGQSRLAVLCCIVLCWLLSWDRSVDSDGAAGKDEVASYHRLRVGGDIARRVGRGDVLQVAARRRHSGREGRREGRQRGREQESKAR